MIEGVVKLHFLDCDEKYSSCGLICSTCTPDCEHDPIKLHIRGKIIELQ